MGLVWFRPDPSSTGNALLSTERIVFTSTSCMIWQLLLTQFAFNYFGSSIIVLKYCQTFNVFFPVYPSRLWSMFLKGSDWIVPLPLKQRGNQANNKDIYWKNIANCTQKTESITHPTKKTLYNWAFPSRSQAILWHHLFSSPVLPMGFPAVTHAQFSRHNDSTIKDCID